MTTLLSRPGRRDPVATYLHRATLGLPADVAEQVRDELEEHLLGRAAQLEHQGLSPTDALTRALRDLGPPGHVTAGMNKVHNMPRLLSLGTLLSLLLGTLVYALAGGTNTPTLTLPVLTQAPRKPACVRGTVPTGVTVVSAANGVTCYTPSRPYSPGIFLSHSQLTQAVKAQGGTVTRQPDGTVKAAFPGGTWMTLGAHSTVQNERYYRVSALASSLSGMFRPDQVRLSGYAQPVLQGGPVRLKFGDGDQNIGELFYQDFGLEFVGWLLGNRQTEATGMSLSWSSSWATGLTDVRHRVQTGQQPGEVVMLVMKQAGNNYFTTFAPVAADGTATFQNVPEQLRFVTGMTDLGPYPSGGRLSALLVRVTNLPLSQLRRGIFVPAQATSDAV